MVISNNEFVFVLNNIKKINNITNITYKNFTYNTNTSDKPNKYIECLNNVWQFITYRRLSENQFIDIINNFDINNKSTYFVSKYSNYFYDFFENMDCLYNDILHLLFLNVGAFVNSINNIHKHNIFKKYDNVNINHIRDILKESNLFKKYNYR